MPYFYQLMGKYIMQLKHCFPLLFIAFTSFSLLADTSASNEAIMTEKSQPSSPLFSDKAFIETIKPYSATYSTVWKKGISFTVKGTQTFSKQAEDTWLLSFKAKTIFASLKESSLFKIYNNRIRPIRYDYHTSAFGKKRDAILTFNWDKKQVINDVKNTKWKMSIEQDTLDKLSVQLQIRQDVRDNKDTLIYQIADGGRLKTWEFKRLASETIKTKLGEIKAIKVIRVDNRGKKKKTVFWFAEKFDYLLVKLEHLDGKEVYKLELESIK